MTSVSIKRISVLVFIFVQSQGLYHCMRPKRIWTSPRYEATTLTKLIPVTLVVMLTFSARGTKNRLHGRHATLSRPYLHPLPPSFHNKFLVALTFLCCFRFIIFNSQIPHCLILRKTWKVLYMIFFRSKDDDNISFGSSSARIWRCTKILSE